MIEFESRRPWILCGAVHLGKRKSQFLALERISNEIILTYHMQIIFFDGLDIQGNRDCGIIIGSGFVRT